MRKLSDKEAKVIRALELCADRPMREVRKETGLRDHTIRYYLRRLIERRVVVERPFINVYPLGYSDYAIYFSVAAEKTQTRERFLRDLVETPQITHVATLGGDYQYGMSVCSRELNEVIEFLERESERFPQLICNKELSIRHSLTLFGRKYLRAGDGEAQQLGFGGRRGSVTLDERDAEILSALEDGGFESLRDLGRALGIPIATLHYRLESLKSKGVLVGMMYEVNAAAFGMQMYRILFYPRGASGDLRKRLFQFAKRHPYVVFHIECLGNWDYEWGVEVQRPEEIVGVTEEVYRNFGTELHSVKILPVFQYLKVRNFPGRPSARVQRRV